MKLLIEAKREAYSTEQCGRTITVGDLIAYLEQFDEDEPVYISNDNGYTYGSLDETDITEEEDSEEEDE